MLNVLLPLCKPDEQQAFWLLEWMGELGKNPNTLFILCSTECRIAELVKAGEKSFANVKHVLDAENVKSDWRNVGHQPKSAAGPNSLFRQAAWYFNVKKFGAWLWMEPDAIPCHPVWLKEIEAEYESCGKPFMGYFVSSDTHPGPVGKHMSGIGVYPENAATILNKAILGTDTAFDIAAANRILPMMHPSRTIFHHYRPPSFTTQEDFEQRVPRELAIYHACKDASIYPFLRSRLGFSSAPHVREVQLAEPLPSKQIVAGSIPVTHSNLITDDEFRAAGLGGPTVDIFIKTRPHDYPWLQFCLNSIKKFGSGFRTVHTLSVDKLPGIVCPWSLEERLPLHLHAAPDKDPGYLWQQVQKLRADEYSDADFILFMDSDCVFTRNVRPDDFIRDGKPIWQYTPLDQARPDQHVWSPVMEKFLGKKPEHEFMRRHPFCVPRWALEELRTFCKYRHGKSLEEYIMGEADPRNGLALRFSEWNCLGFFLWEYHRDKVAWVIDADAEPACVYQGFTHGGEKRKQEDLAKFREILGQDGTRVEGEPPTSCAIPAVSTPILTEASAIQFLASHVKNNFHKARIVRDLKKAWKGKGEAPRRKDKPFCELTFKGKFSREVSYGLLLCVHSYPGGNDTFKQHWPHFQKFGATRIAGIGTTDGKCTWPDGLDAVVDIGHNSYMKQKGKDDHLCRRLLDTVKWCLTQPEDHFAIVEYDTLILKKFPRFQGVHAHLTGGQTNGSKATQYYHNPWAFDRESGEALVRAMEEVLPDSQEFPNNSPDLFFGLAVERAQIEVKCCFKLFTRNSLDLNGDLDLAVEAALGGVHAIHGVKNAEEYHTIMSALNEQHLALSHVA